MFERSRRQIRSKRDPNNKKDAAHRYKQCRMFKTWVIIELRVGNIMSISHLISIFHLLGPTWGILTVICSPTSIFSERPFCMLSSSHIYNVIMHWRRGGSHLLRSRKFHSRAREKILSNKEEKRIAVHIRPQRTRRGDSWLVETVFAVPTAKFCSK